MERNPAAIVVTRLMGAVGVNDVVAAGIDMTAAGCIRVGVGG